MGTRINVLLAHKLSDWSCREESLEILLKALPSVNVVKDYWDQQDEKRPTQLETWIAEPPFPPPETRDYLRYTGPGSFFVSINPSAVWIHTGGRWRGFLSIPELWKVHLTAFRSLANAFGANVLYCFADNDFAQGEFWDGRGVTACTDILEQQMGDPVKLLDSIDPAVAKATENGCPQLWYWDDLS